MQALPAGLRAGELVEALAEFDPADPVVLVVPCGAEHMAILSLGRLVDVAGEAGGGEVERIPGLVGIGAYVFERATQRRVPWGFLFTEDDGTDAAP